MKVIGQSSKTAFFYKKEKNDLPDWQLFYKKKCNSTEFQLDDYLKKKDKLTTPVAIISKEQTAGFGQHKRNWISPKGGIWLSAAYPIYSSEFLIDVFSLSIACKFCELLPPNSDSRSLKLKWPNDILYGSKKLIGFLPKVVTRGEEILYVRIGIGFNLNNKTPDEGIPLSKVLKKNRLSEHYWTSKILTGIGQAIKYNHQRKRIISDANTFIDKQYLPRGYRNNNFQIKDIDSFGNLRLLSKNQIKVIKV